MWNLKWLLVLLGLVLSGCAANSYKGEFTGFGNMSANIAKGSDSALACYEKTEFQDDGVTPKSVTRAKISMKGSKSDLAQFGENLTDAYYARENQEKPRPEDDCEFTN